MFNRYYKAYDLFIYNFLSIFGKNDMLVHGFERIKLKNNIFKLNSGGMIPWFPLSFRYWKVTASWSQLILKLYIHQILCSKCHKLFLERFFFFHLFLSINFKILIEPLFFISILHNIEASSKMTESFFYLFMIQNYH